MIEAGIEGIEFLVANTDLQALKRSRAPIKIQLGGKLTKGLGAGADPIIGRNAALEDTEKIIEALEGADMVFVRTCLCAARVTGLRADHRSSPGTQRLTSPLHQALQFRQTPHSPSTMSDRTGAIAWTVITIPNEGCCHGYAAIFRCGASAGRRRAAPIRAGISTHHTVPCPSPQTRLT